MAEERLEIILEADVAKAQKAIEGFTNVVTKEFQSIPTAIKIAENQLAKFSAALKGATSAGEVEFLNRNIATLQSRLETLRGSAVKAGAAVATVGKSAVNANPALVNFGRVVQDAPFGLIGIANNIDPLISSFQSLQKSTGSAGGAFKALGASLLGPAGIGIAVSVVTSALIAFGPAIGRAIGGVSEFDQTLREAGGKGAEAFSKATETFGNFLRVVNDTGASVARQNAALDGANKALGEYGLQVGSLSQLQKQGAAIGAIYAQIKQEEAKSSILAAKAAEEYAKGVALGIAIEQGDTLGAANALSIGNLVKSLLLGGSAVGSTATAVAGLGDAFGVANSKQKAYEAENEKTKLGIDNLIKSLGQVPGVIEKQDKAKKKSVEASSKNNELEKVFATQRKAAILLTTEETSELLNLAKAADKAFLAKQKQANLDKQKAIAGATGQVALPKVKLGQSIEDADTKLKKLQAAAQTTEDIIEGGVGFAIDNVFNSIANGENVFKNLAEGVKGLAFELAAAVAKALILKAIFSVINLGSGGVGGTFLGGILGSVLGGRAGGGMVTPGGGYIVGENGPEKFYPTQAGSIVPAGGGMGGGELTAKFSANTLLFAVSTAARNQRMNFG